MIEVVGNLWTFPADCRVITTNGTVKKNGECVMGRGCAAEAKRRPEYSHYNIAQLLGEKISKDGNHVHYLGTPAHKLYSFPVKHQWMQKADLNLIQQSASELVEEIDELQTKFRKELTVVLPRPGCGNGGLRWEDVHPILEPILDDRFHIITWR